MSHSTTSVMFSFFIVAHSAKELVHSRLSGPCEAGSSCRPSSHDSSTARGKGLLLSLRRLVWLRLVTVVSSDVTGVMVRTGLWALPAQKTC